MGKGLLKKIAGARLDRVHSCGHGAMSGQHNDGHGRLCAADMVQELKAVHPGHPEIRDDRLNRRSRVL